MPGSGVRQAKFQDAGLEVELAACGKPSVSWAGSPAEALAEIQAKARFRGLTRIAVIEAEVAPRTWIALLTYVNEHVGDPLAAYLHVA